MRHGLGIGARLRRKSVIGALVLALLLSSGCFGGETASRKSAELSFFSMDTYMYMTVYGKNARAAAEAAEARICRLETLFSRTLPGSDISEVNAAAPEKVTVSDDTASIIGKAKEYAELTEGAFDMTIGPVMDAWGFGHSRNDEACRVPGDDELKSLLELVGSDGITLGGNTVSLAKSGMALDPGGIGKGYAADAAAAVLREAGVESAIMSLGGNVVAVGSKPDGSPWRTAIRHPERSDAYAGILEITDLAAVTTGGYERYFEKGGVVYHHVMDPATGRPADAGIVSATIICESSTVADILSTAVFVRGEAWAEDFQRVRGDFEMVLLTSDGRAVVTRGIADRFTLEPDSGYTLDAQ